MQLIKMLGKYLHDEAAHRKSVYDRGDLEIERYLFIENVAEPLSRLVDRAAKRIDRFVLSGLMIGSGLAENSLRSDIDPGLWASRDLKRSHYDWLKGSIGFNGRSFLDVRVRPILATDYTRACLATASSDVLLDYITKPPDNEDLKSRVAHPLLAAIDAQLVTRINPQATRSSASPRGKGVSPFVDAVPNDPKALNVLFPSQIQELPIPVVVTNFPEVGPVQETASARHEPTSTKSPPRKNHSKEKERSGGDKGGLNKIYETDEFDKAFHQFKKENPNASQRQCTAHMRRWSRDYFTTKGKRDPNAPLPSDGWVRNRCATLRAQPAAGNQ